MKKSAQKISHVLGARTNNKKTDASGKWNERHGVKSFILIVRWSLQAKWVILRQSNGNNKTEKNSLKQSSRLFENHNWKLIRAIIISH